MVTIIFEAHGTSIDNEAHRASGHADVALSALGEQQARQLGARYAIETFDAVFCSDLRRSYTTAEIAFADRALPILQDARLRECDYGQLTGNPAEEIESVKARYVTQPFPGGKSYEQTAQRMKSFLKDLLEKYDGKKVLIIGHRATQYGLEHWLNGVVLATAVTAPWQWQPGWEYSLTSLLNDKN